MRKPWPRPEDSEDAEFVFLVQAVLPALAERLGLGLNSIAIDLLGMDGPSAVQILDSLHALEGEAMLLKMVVETMQPRTACEYPEPARRMD